MNSQAHVMSRMASFQIDSFAMDFLPREMCPTLAQIQLSGEALAIIEKASSLIKTERFIKDISIQPSALKYKLSYFNENGKEINIEEQMELSISVDSTPGYSRLSIVLSANETEITDDESEEAYNCNGEFFGEVVVSDL